MKTFDPIQAEQIMGRAFKATVRQKFIFRFHRRLLSRFWAAMKRNIEWSSDHLDEDDDLGDTIHELIADLQDLLTLC